MINITEQDTYNVLNDNFKKIYKQLTNVKYGYISDGDTSLTRAHINLISQDMLNKLIKLHKLSYIPIRVHYQASNVGYIFYNENIFSFQEMKEKFQ